MTDPILRPVPPLREGDLLTVKEAMALLPVGRTTLFDLIRTGKLPCLRVGTDGSKRKRILLLRSGLDDFVRRNLTVGAPAMVDPDSIRGRVLARARERGRAAS